MAQRLGGSGGKGKAKGGGKGSKPRAQPRGIDGKDHDGVTGKVVLQKGDFLDLAHQIRSLQGDAQSTNGEIGNLMKKADSLGVNRKALKDALKVARMDDSKAADYRADFDTYCDWLGVGTQGEIFNREESGRAGQSETLGEAGSKTDEAGDPLTAPEPLH